MKLTPLILLFSISVWATDPTVLTIKVKDKNFNFQKKEDVWVSESCLKDDCTALKKAEIKTKKSSDGLAGHPAADFCEQEGGEYVTGKRLSGDEDGLCVFKDKSFILGWDYYKRNEKKVTQ